LPDERESVVINKIALEYRKLRALQNGGKGDSLYTSGSIAARDQAHGIKVAVARDFKIKMRANKLQYFFRDPTGHLQ